MNIELLEEIGLTKSEIKVYLALLELGSSSTGKIVDKSKASSSKIYEILDKLMHKGLASYIIKSGIKHFEAAAPERLLDYMSERKKSFEEKEKQLESLIPQLEIKRSLAGIGSETQVFKGIKGAETAFKDIINTLNKGDELVVLGHDELDEIFQNFLLQFYTKRDIAGIKLRGIFGEKTRILGGKISLLPHSQIKYSSSKNPTAVLIYGDKTLFSLARDRIWIQIRNKNLADTQRSHFNSLWEQETQVVRGLDAIEKLFNEMLEEGQCDFIGARGYFMDYRPEYILKWEKEAKKSGFKMRNIVDPDVEGHTITNFKFAKTKYTLDKSFVDLSVYWIFGNKVAISNWAGEEPIVMIIENKQIVDMYKKQFELLWNK